MNTNFDLIIIGSGPGGYVAAIRASQLGMKVVVVEKAELGGICLNWGCIPTKALLKSAQVFEYLKHSEDYGITTSDPKVDFTAIVKRSRDVAGGMSRGIQFLFRKNKIEHVNGFAKLTHDKKIEVTAPDGNNTMYSAPHIIIATGARARELPNLKIDGNKIIGYRKAMTLEKLPEQMVVVGSGAIGSEFAYFYQSLGTKVTLIEFMPNLVPLEDEEISKQLLRNFKKQGMNIKLESTVENVSVADDKCHVSIKTKTGIENIETDIVLLERLAQIDKEKSLMFIKTKKELLGRHWTKIVPLFNFLKAYYPKHIIETYVKDNQETFKTSSHLKKHLKEECGVFISQREGNLVVEVKNDKN